MAVVTIVTNGGAKVDTANAVVATSAISGGAVGDLVLAWSVCERATGKGVVTGGTGSWTEATVQTGTNHVLAFYWKRMGTGDTSFAVTASAVLISGGTSTTRRMSVNYAVFRGCVDPVLVTKTPVAAPGTSSQVAPNATPTVADSMLVALIGSIAINTPFLRTWSGHTATWTELRQLPGASTTLTNPGSVATTKQLVGQSGVAQTGDTTTYVSAEAGTVGNAAAAEYTALTVVLAPGTVNQAPNAGISSSKLTGIEAGEEFTLTLTESDDVAVTSRTFRQVSGTTATVTGSGLSRTVEAPWTLAGGTLVFGYKTNDGTLDSTEATVSVDYMPARRRQVTVGGATPTEVPLKRLLVT